VLRHPLLDPAAAGIVAEASATKFGNNCNR
jgi:hypothetical protein